MLLLAKLLALALVAAAESSAPPKVKQLLYFDARGAAELVRVLLNVGKIPFEDTRFSIIQNAGKFETPDFTKAKESGALKANMDRVPLMILDNGVNLGQSKAMERYVARECGMMGTTALETAVIDCVAEHVRDIKDKWGKVRNIGGMAPNAEKDEATAKFLSADGEYFQFLGKLERSLPQDRTEGFSVGSSSTYADLSIWNLVKDTFLDDNTQAPSLAVAAKFSAIMKICTTVESNTDLKEYLANRKVTKF